MRSIVCLLAFFLLAVQGQLSEKIEVENIVGHLEKLLQIARLDGRHSRSVLNNYPPSGDYVISALEGLCEVSVQKFVVPVHEVVGRPRLVMVSPSKTEFQYGVDFADIRYGGEGSHNFTAPLFKVRNYGCAADDFKGLANGSIVLIQEGSCDLVNKAFLAEDAGASAIFFYNGQSRTSLLTSRVRIVDWKEGDRLVRKPVLALSNVMGKLLSNAGSSRLSVEVEMKLTEAETFNVICDSFTGSKDNVVMAGAHLDSVPEGPGINDNGSGSATLLEIALQFFKSGVKNANAVRFAWWGAEEIGLLGSRHYVRDLQQNNPSGLAKLVLYLNFDMLGSPNFIPYIHDGYQVEEGIPEDVKASSRILQGLFEDYFKASDLPYELNGMYGGSDFLPFIQAGIPSSGMATGAGSIKTEAERTEFSGLANAAYDPCYHLACDTVENISREGLRQCAESSANTIERLALEGDLRGFLGRPEEQDPVFF